MAPAGRELGPYPSGWYAIAFARELKPGRTLTRPFMGRELVLFRTASGRAAAVDAYCPHLGAHLGYGGRVEGECLRCPFHGFRFDASGRCVETGYGTKPPPSAVLTTWPLREVNAMLLVYYGSDGRPYEWEVPPLPAGDWSPTVYRRFSLRAHPQETTENSVDLGHFSWVHGYRTVRMLREVVIDGAHLSTAYAVQRPAPLLGRRWPAARVEVEFETHIHGLGYSQVDVRVHGYGIRARLWVLPTPIDAERLALCLAASGDGGDGVHPWLQPLPRALRARLIARVMLAGLVADARQDFAIWQHKHYVHRPALASGDGPIGKYRLWARRFYEEPTRRLE
jgi:nitrite reductase/ring-hydroxylating ferredoxin subunit